MNEMVKLLQLYEDIKGDIYGKLYKGTRKLIRDIDEYNVVGTFFATSKWLAQQVEKLVRWYTYMLPNERAIDAKEIYNAHRNWQYLEQNGVFEKLKRDGYDAVILNESGEHTLFIFSPIKDKLEYIKLISDNKSIK